VEEAMQLTVNQSLSNLPFDFRLLTNGHEPDKRASQIAPLTGDRIELSDDSRRSRESGSAVSQLLPNENDRGDTQFMDFLNDILREVTGGSIRDLQTYRGMQDRHDSAAQFPGLEAQQSTIAVDSTSLSIGGTIQTGDGAKLAFSLDLQVTHASFKSEMLSLDSGPNGYQFSYAGAAAELTSTSFTFSLAAASPEDGSSDTRGIGSFSLKDGLKDLRHALKPLAKDLFSDAGISSGWSGVNRLLQTIA
jgi:hypothetical protein